MIFYTKTPSEQTPRNIVLSKIDTGYKLELTESDKVYTYTITPTCTEILPNMVHLGFSRTKGIYCFYGSDTKESRSGLAFAYATNSGTCEGSILHFCSFWVPDSSVDNLVIVMNGHAVPEFENIDSSELQYIEGIKSADEVISKYVESSQGWFTRANAKRKLIEKINELDSLAMIEAQLDLLTRYVLTGEGKDTLANSVDGCLVTTIHEDAKLLDTVKKQKTYLRSLQTKYFNERGDYEIAKLSS